MTSKTTNKFSAEVRDRPALRKPFMIDGLKHAIEQAMQT